MTITNDTNNKATLPEIQLDSWALKHTQNHHLPFGDRLNPRRQDYYDDEEHGTFVYHSRPNRKNRLMEFEPDRTYWTEHLILPPLPRLIAFDLTNISWHVAIWFTLGSICWIINGQVFLWPTSSETKTSHIEGYSALVGGLMFWIGAYLAIVEALNERITSTSQGAYGMELKHLLHHLENQDDDVQFYVKKYLTRAQKIEPGWSPVNLHNTRHRVCVMQRCPTMRWNDPPFTCDGASLKWRWWGSEVRSMGWWASVIQFTGATCFTVSVITGTPGVSDSSQWELQFALIWSMQVIGSICFVIASAMLMLEEQRQWYAPALDRIGWHSAFWNVIGSIGFLLSACFGYLGNWKGQGPVCCQMGGTGVNTYYGSWAFLIASVLMLIEVQNKQPATVREYMERAWAWVSTKVFHRSRNK